MSGDGRTWALVAAWVVLVVGPVWSRRPRAAPLVPRAAAWPAPPDPAARLVVALRRLVRPGSEAEVRPGDRERGIGILAAGVLVVVLPPLAPLALLAGAAVGPLRARRVAAARAAAAADALPDAVDLLALAVGSGLPVGAASGLVAPHVGAPLGPAMAAVAAQVDHGVALDAALEPLARASPTARPLAALLLAAHVDGAPVVASLERLADEARADRRRAVEARARQVPVRMLFPLVLCTLPAFVLLTIVPPVMAALGGIRT